MVVLRIEAGCVTVTVEVEDSTVVVLMIEAG